MSPVGDAWRTMPPREIPAFAGMEILLIDAAPIFHSGESRNLCGEAAFAEGDHCNVPLRGKFSLSRE